MKNLSYLLIVFLMMACKSKKIEQEMGHEETKEKVISTSTEKPWIEMVLDSLNRDDEKIIRPEKIWSYQYKNQKVFYFVQPCCDQINPVYDSKGNIICHPDGGFTGKGDGKCNDFYQTVSQRKLIWGEMENED